MPSNQATAAPPSGGFPAVVSHMYNFTVFDEELSPK
jgi:hypothetical protein